MKMKKDGQLLLLTGLILTTMMLIIGTIIASNIYVLGRQNRSSLVNDYPSIKDKFGYCLEDNINSNNTTKVEIAVNKTIQKFKDVLTYQNVFFEGELINITNTTYIYVNVSFYIKDDVVSFSENITFVFSAIDYKFIRRS